MRATAVQCRSRSHVRSLSTQRVQHGRPRPLIGRSPSFRKYWRTAGPSDCSRAAPSLLLLHWQTLEVCFPEGPQAASSTRLSSGSTLTQWQRLFRQALYDTRPMECPFAPLAGEFGDDGDLVDGVWSGPSFSLVGSGASSGWGYVASCWQCGDVLYLSLCHEMRALAMDLQINQASSWHAATPIGFELTVADQCSCGL